MAITALMILTQLDFFTGKLHTIWTLWSKCHTYSERCDSLNGINVLTTQEMLFWHGILWYVRVCLADTRPNCARQVWYWMAVIWRPLARAAWITSTRFAILLITSPLVIHKNQHHLKGIQRN